MLHDMPAAFRRPLLSIAAASLAAIASGGLASAAPQDQVFTPEHVAKLRGVTSAAISPDGRYIAHVVSVPRVPFVDESGPAWSELHVVDQRGVRRPFVTGEGSVRGVQWTPDGRAISFTQKREGDEHAALYVIPVDGGEARRVLEHATGVGEYSWSPDGERVAFLARDEKPKDVAADEKKGFDSEVYEEELLFTRLWIASPDLDPYAEAEGDEPRMLELEGQVGSPRWSPDGRHIALTLAPTPLVDDRYMLRRIHVVDVESGASVAQVDTSGKLGDFRWSPDGARLALIAGEDQHDPKEGRLMVVGVAGGAPANLSDGYLGHVSSVRWRDADTLVVLADEGVWSTLFRVDADGSNRETILPVGKYVLGQLTLSKDGASAAFVGDSPRHPREVFSMQHGHAAPRRITDSNPWLADVRLARQQAVLHEARDGTLLEGLLIYPLEHDPEQRYPLIMVVHGGPEAHQSNGWLTRYSSPGQVGAARGFAVYYPNYRGSTGRGVEFSKAGQADYAGKEFDDLVDAADHLIEAGLVERGKVGVTGGSYGGFASAWCATALTEHFAAAVMFVGISEQVSKFGTTDIPNEMFKVHARKWPWEDWDFFAERSPVRHAEKSRTPILIMHGKNDTRVHPSQSMVLYRYLKTLGQVPVRLVFYPGEGHGNRKSGAQLDYNLRLMRWMEHYLQGPGGEAPPQALDYDAYRPGSEDDEDVVEAAPIEAGG